MATVAVLNRWIDERATLEDACTALAEDALVVRNHVDDHLRFHRIAVSVLARSVAREELNDSASVTRLLRLTDDVYPGLSELSAFDSTGKLLATTRKGAWLPNGSSWGVSRANESFFRAALTSDSTIVTGVHRDAASSIPIVTIAQRVRDGHGGVRGVVEASLDLAGFSGFSSSRNFSRRAVIVDTANRVVYASLGVPLNATDSLTTSWMNARGWQFETQRQRGLQAIPYFNARTTLAATIAVRGGWRVYIERPLDAVFVQVQARRSAILLAVAVALILGIVVAVLLAEQVRAPLREMSAWLHSFDVRQERTALPAVSPSAPEELLALHDTVSRLATRLHTSYQESQRVVAEKETLNLQLNEVLKELDARVAARTSELQEALRLAHEASVTKSRFLANMSHELRTPLNSVIGFSSVMLKNRSGKLGKAELEMQERVLANGRHLLTLINDILDISKIEAGHTALDLEECDIVALIQDTLGQLEGQIAVKPIALRYRGPERARPLTTDAGKVRQILINLVGNAIKFTGEGEVTVELETQGDGSVSLMRVRDSGIGIPAARLEAIFQPFEQADTSTSRRFGGTGLGLAISRSLSEMLGAQLTVSSELGVGSTFTLAFVDAARADVTSETRKRAREAVRGILIA